jgi:hypothetical protein
LINLINSNNFIMKNNNIQPSDESEEMDYGAEQTYVDSRVVKTVRKLRIRYFYISHPYQQRHSQRPGHCSAEYAAEPAESLELSPSALPKTLVRPEESGCIQQGNS